jgi:exonuclease SbcD
VILAGDLFDGEDRSLRAQSRLRTEMLKLAEKNIPVFVIHGNHDHLNGSWVQLDLPGNVHSFSERVESKVFKAKDGSTAHLYGFSYPVRHVYEKIINEYKKVPGADFHIGILHGNESSSHEHDNYAPFTIKDLNDKGFDYWALGHIHKRKILSENPPVVYPGNIQGRNKKETGVKGFYHVELTEAGASLEFLESSDIIWEEALIDAAEARSFYEIFQLCQEAINQKRREKTAVLLTIVIQNVQLGDTRERRSLDSDLMELLMDGEIEAEAFVWPVKIRISDSRLIDKEMLKNEGEFYNELFRTVTEYKSVTEPLTSLYEHHLGRKYINQLSEEEKLELLNSAEKLLLQLLN